MELDLKFSKFDSSSSWGFRVVGGADFQEPLVVVKVHGNSLAENAGLKEGDIIASINGYSTSTLTQFETRKLISSAGKQFVLGIKRGEIIAQHLLEDIGKEIETEKVVRDVQVSVVEEIIDKAEELAEILGKEIFTEFGEHKSAIKKKSEKKMVFSNSTQTYIPTEDKYKQKKWSTFMMKPDRPQPKPKKIIEEPTPEIEPYKIVIKKQSRRKPLPKEKRVQFDQNVIQVDLESVSSRTLDSPELPISPDPDQYRYEDDPDYQEENNLEYENGYMEYNEDNSLPQNEENEEYDVNNNETEFDGHIRKGSLEIKYKPLSEIIIDDPNSDTAMTLEEQLRAVQRQLEALSQLPSAVQITLDAVSKQLASIVSTNDDDEHEMEENKEKEDNKENSISAEAQAEINSQDGEDSIIGDELEEDYLADEELKNILNSVKLEEENEDEEVEQIETQENIEDIYRINEEELEEKRKEEELLAKKEKEMSAPSKPTYRPIVLPGGRKWIDPDDVVPTRKPKMSDEAIMESIESNLEVIAGNRKGINFMKNTPPIKNLDHLQRSEVYRLVHGMEPPIRGITTRPEKILPEQDYYEASRTTP